MKNEDLNVSAARTEVEHTSLVADSPLIVGSSGQIEAIHETASPSESLLAKIGGLGTYKNVVQECIIIRHLKSIYPGAKFFIGKTKMVQMDVFEWKVVLNSTWLENTVCGDFNRSRDVVVSTVAERIRISSFNGIKFQRQPHPSGSETSGNQITDDELSNIIIRNSNLGIPKILGHITDGLASFLVNTKSNIGYPGDLFFDGLTEIRPTTARILAEHSFAIALNGLKTIDPAVADSFEGRSGVLYLNGIYNISVECAHRLSKTVRELSLNGLASLSPEIANALVNGSSNIIHLNGLSRVDDDVAEILSAGNGIVYLKGVKNVSVNTAKIFISARARSLAHAGTTRKIITSIDLELIVPRRIEVEHVKRYLLDPDSIDLRDASSISCDAAEMLVGKEDACPQSEIVSLLDAVKEARRTRNSYLWFKLPSKNSTVTQRRSARPIDANSAHICWLEDQLYMMQLRDDDHDEYCDVDHELRESDRMQEELASDNEDFSRSSNDGWFYSDEDAN